MGRNVTLAYGGHVIYPRASITNIEGASGDISGGSSTGGSTNYAASAGGLTTSAKNAIISSAVNKVSSVN